MFKRLKFLFFLFLLLSPGLVLADNGREDVIFEARVLEVVEQRENELRDGNVTEQQNVRLRGLEGEFKGEEFVFEGIGGFDAIKKNIYGEGDRVLAAASFNDEGEPTFYIIDYVRSNSLLAISVLFAVLIVVIGGFKGLRSLFSLAVTFFIMIKYIVPEILAGSNPMFVTALGSFFILLSIIYLTEGFRRRSHIAVLSIFIALILVLVLAKIFISLAHLSGLSSEESFSLISLGGSALNFQGLLLAGIIIGSLGVLDDVVISQVVAVEKLREADKSQSRKEIFKKAYEIGTSHISSMTNTLFLAYAGVSLPLLLFFVSGDSAFSSWTQIVNSEQIATEIIRTIAGSIGLVMAVPISTAIAVFWMKK